MAAPFAPDPEPGRGGGALVSWAERTARWDRRPAGRGMVRFVFYGRVSTEDWQDPVTSRARQREQAEALVRGHGQIVADFFDVGQTRKLAWACRPQSATLVAQLADPDRGWDAIVIGEYERAFYGSQYAAMAPLFEHYGVQLWMPEAGGRVDYASEHDEKTMTVLGLSSKREITRTSIRVRTAMAVQTREQGRYLGGRPGTGCRLADAGPHPEQGARRVGPAAHRLEPDPRTAPTVRWIFAAPRRPLDGATPGAERGRDTRARPRPTRPGTRAAQRRAGRSARSPRSWRTPRYTGRQVWNRRRTDAELVDPANVTLGHRSVQRWNLPDGWVVSSRPAHPALVGEDDFVAAQDVNAARGPVPQDEPVLRRYLLAGLLACGVCGRRDRQPGPTARACLIICVAGAGDPSVTRVALAERTLS